MHNSPEILIDDKHWEAHAVAYVQGELSPDQRVAFERILAKEARCRERVFELRQLFDALAEIPQKNGPIDLIAALHEQIAAEPSYPAPAAQMRFWTQPGLRVAAGLVILLGAALAIRSLTPTHETAQVHATPSALATPPVNPPSLEKGLAWLANAQSPSGAWHAERDEGRPQNSVGLTGLALLAFTHDPVTQQNERYRDVLQRGVDYLLKTQSADGRFGGRNQGTRFDHAIATLALIEVYRAERDTRLGRAAHAALRHVNGDPIGMSYQSHAIAQSNAAWTELVMLRAEELGLGHSARQASSASHALLQRALAELTHGRSESLGGEAALLARQNTEGDAAGSWQAFGPVGTVRGRVFSTSVAALLLQLPVS